MMVILTAGDAAGDLQHRKPRRPIPTIKMFKQVAFLSQHSSVGMHPVGPPLADETVGLSTPGVTREPPRVVASPTPSPEQLSSANKRRKRSGGAATTPAPAADTRRDHTRVEISPDKAQYCQVCRGHWAAHREDGWAEKDLKQRCNFTKFGCVPCKQRICDECNVGWDHRTMTTSRTDWKTKKHPPKKLITKKK